MSGLEPAWPTGPLLVKGTGNGKRSVYVCSGCLSPTVGVYRVKRGVDDGQNWFCATCRTKVMRKQEQPSGLRAYLDKKSSNARGGVTQ